ncbi:MAG: DUF6506 family protein [Bacillota bacterium]
MKKYAFMLMGDYTGEKHTCSFEQGGTLTRICTVSSFQEAREKVLQLWNEDFGALELCGAFSRDQALELMELTNNRMAIGYMVHEPILDGVFAEFFSA